MAKGDLPVLVGVGQSLSQWDGTSGADGAPSPLSLMVDASRAALSDSGADLSKAIDTIAVVRIFEDSVGGAPHPHGHNTNLPGTLARDIGAAPDTLIYETVGGQSPQALVNEMAARIHAGDADCVLISGSEANRASKGARRNNVEINWADGADADYEDRGMGPMMLSREEIKHGIVAPAYFYGLFENAIAAREGHSRSQHRKAMAELFQPFSVVAAKNPYSQFPEERSVEFLSTPSKANYEYADPFLKWFIAQDAVNQGAAAILMSSSKADALGVPEDKRVYLHGAGEAADDLISLRPRLDGSWAMQTAIDRALDQAAKATGDIKHLDLYSCFPCAVFSSTAALGIDWKNDPRPLTLTGGLPFFWWTRKQLFPARYRGNGVDPSRRSRQLWPCARQWWLDDKGSGRDLLDTEADPFRTRRILCNTNRTSHALWRGLRGHAGNLHGHAWQGRTEQRHRVRTPRGWAPGTCRRIPRCARDVT